MAKKPTIVEGGIFQTRSSGDLKILKRFNKTKILIEFIETGFKKFARSSDISRGSVKDLMKPSVCGIGFLGSEISTINEGGSRTKEYATWKDMLTRVYSPKSLKKFPSYLECSVCERWHNFTSFSEDIKSLEGYSVWKDHTMHLDKDLKIRGNKVYSPEACMFVETSENCNVKRKE